VGLVLLVMKNGMRQGKEQNFLINQKENLKKMIGIKIDQIEENGQDHVIVNAIVAIDQGIVIAEEKIVIWLILKLILELKLISTVVISNQILIVM